MGQNFSPQYMFEQDESVWLVMLQTSHPNICVSFGLNWIKFDSKIYRQAENSPDSETCKLSWEIKFPTQIP